MRRHTAQDATGIVVTNEAGDALLAYGAAPPADGRAGYATGCLFCHTDGTAITAAYLNKGTAVSCDFDPLLSFAQGAALTPGLTALSGAGITPGTPDYAIQALTNLSPFGFVTADEGQTVISVVANLQTRLAEVEARLEAAGIVASN